MENAETTRNIRMAKRFRDVHAQQIFFFPVSGCPGAGVVRAPQYLQKGSRLI